jgi:hypothetical protein
MRHPYQLGSKIVFIVIVMFVLFMPVASARKAIGIEVREITDQDRQMFAIDPGQLGVIVVSLLPGGNAQYAGILPGDVIMGVNGINAETVPILQQALQDAPNPALINVIRRGQLVNFYVNISEGPDVVMAPPGGKELLWQFAGTPQMEKGVIIHAFLVSPERVTRGGSFDLSVEFTVSDYYGDPKKILTSQLTYEISKDGVVKLAKQSALSSEQNKRTTCTKKGLKASVVPGVYNVRVMIDYDGEIAGKTATLIVE